MMSCGVAFAGSWTLIRAIAAVYLATMSFSAEMAVRSATMSGAGGGGVPRA